MTTDPFYLMSTHTGRKLDIYHLRPEDVDPADVAHGLSNLCRFVGQTRQFYSVAQHSLLVARFLPEHLKLQGLLHDAAEAYVGDVASFIKHRPEMRWYRDLEDRVQRVIAERFNAGWPFDPEVKRADLAAYHCERSRVVYDSVRVGPWMTPGEAKRKFLAALDQFTVQKSAGRVDALV